jgi:amidohydrolase
MSDLQDLTVGYRRELHADPEVGLDLPRTQEKVLQGLDGLPLELSLGKTSSSVTAVLRGNRPGPTVLLRADMDALPLKEQTGLAFAAHNGAMHACGHDLHTAMLLGAAHLLVDRRDQLAGDVVLAFQAGEEGYDGAGHMLAEGLLDASGAKPTAAFALHVTSGLLPVGVLAGRPGPTMAAADSLDVVVRGRGGHGSSPHLAADPVQAIAAMVTALQVAVTREFDLNDPVVVSVGELHAGTAHNIIPDTASLRATVRSFSLAAQDKLRTVLPRVCRGVALAHDVEVDVEYVTMFPPTVNDPAEAEWGLQHARERLGEERVIVLPFPTTGSEDFSRVLQAVPGAMLFLGATPKGLDPASAPFNHAPQADFDESVLEVGASLYASLAEERLALVR